MKIKYIIAGLLFLLFTSCDNTLQCERHFLPRQFLGKVVIVFNQKDGQKKVNQEGCIVYYIPQSGDCKSALPIKSGTAYPNETFRYFLGMDPKNSIEIFEFLESDYFKDTTANKYKKYIFNLYSGYSAPNNVFGYEVDYGSNYKKHYY